MNRYLYYMNAQTGDVDTLDGWEERGALIVSGKYIPVKLDVVGEHDIRWIDDTGIMIGWENSDILGHHVYNKKSKEYIPIIQMEESARRH